MKSVGPRAARIQALLKRELAPLFFDLRDESARHAGHAGRNDLANGETHFALALASARFVGLTPLQRHRLVNELVAGEFASGLHALSLTLTLP